MVDEAKVAEIMSCQVRVFPNDANHVGNMFGGRIMEIMDSCAGITADRFASDAHHCVTATVETVQFRLPVHVGDILKFDSQVVYAGRTSMVIRVDAYRYARGQQEEDLCTSAHLIFVAMDAESKSVPVPELAVASGKARDAWKIGKAVRGDRAETQNNRCNLHIAGTPAVDD
ncbi:acyl-CoA thioesterase [Desulfopila sp. IMCC35008]|uniref:acyl-CoA thioesterase n=1 Tax=Desulfopila sp. IMCC35008 TaxID=2653858 RepID=UPI0013D099C6|nr:acyl-CoA thioesterase [Desulfopila sp. IMCC35008]